MWGIALQIGGLIYHLWAVLSWALLPKTPEQDLLQKSSSITFYAR